MRDAAGSATAPAAGCGTCLRWGSFPVANPASAFSFDPLVRAGKQERWHIETIGFELVHALPAIDHAHTLLGTACISGASAVLKLRSPGAAPLYWPRPTTTRSSYAL